MGKRFLKERKIIVTTTSDIPKINKWEHPRRTEPVWVLFWDCSPGYIKHANVNSTIQKSFQVYEDGVQNVRVVSANQDNCKVVVRRRRLGWKPSDDIPRRIEGFHHSANATSRRRRYY